MKNLIIKHKWKILISSLLTLLPVLVGIIFWDTLPKQMAIHWGINGEADGYATRLFAVIIMPILLLVVHWVCLFFTAYDKSNKDQNAKMFGMIFWIIPVISNYCNIIIYTAAFGLKVNLLMLTCILFGVLFIFMGNYMPKCKPNKTLGIKLSWTLANEDNWNKTHRFSGKVFVISGFVFLIAAFIPATMIPYVTCVLFIITIVSCILYSYFYYRKQLKEGKITKEDVKSITKKPMNKGMTIFTSIMLSVIIVFASLVTFTGKIEAVLTEYTLQIKPSYLSDITINYSDIEKIEFREQGVVSTRVYGFGSAKLLMGTFVNDEFGNHSRYTYTQSKPCVVIYTETQVYVIGLSDTDSTRTLYEQLLPKSTNTKGDS